MSTENVRSAKKCIEFDGIIEEAATTRSTTYPFWGSARMAYTICAFISMILQLKMRNSLNYVILHMDKELKWTRSELLYLQSAYYYGYVITLSIAGRLADKFGGKVFLVHSTTLQALIFIGMPLYARSNYTWMLVMQILQGLIAGCNNPALYQLFSVWAHPSESTAVLSFAYSGFSLGTLIIYPLASFLCNFGWDVVFYTIGGVSLICGITFQKLVYSTLESHPRLDPQERAYLKSSKTSTTELKKKFPWKDILTSIPIYAFVLTHIFHSYGLIVLSLMIPRYLLETLNIPLNKVGLYSSAPFIGSFLSQGLTVLVSGIVEQIFKMELCKFRRILYVVCSLATVLLLVGVIFCDKDLEYLLLCLLFGIGLTSGLAFSAGYWPTLLFMAPNYAGLLSGVATSLATCSGFLAPIVIEKIVVQGTQHEWDIIMITLAVFYGLSALIYGVFGRSERQA